MAWSSQAGTPENLVMNRVPDSPKQQRLECSISYPLPRTAPPGEYCYTFNIQDAEKNIKSSREIRKYSDPSSGPA